MNKYWITLLISMSIFFYSCNKNNIKIEKCLVSKIILSSSIEGINRGKIEYTYDESNKISKKNFYLSEDTTNIWYSQVFTYSSDNKLKKCEIINSGTTSDSTVYEYISANICKSSEYRPIHPGIPWKLTYTNIWVSNSKGQIISDTCYANYWSNNQFWYYKTFQYDDKDNCIKMTRYYNQGPWEIYEFEYNYKLNPFYYQDYLEVFGQDNTNSPAPISIMHNFVSKFLGKYSDSSNSQIDFTFDVNSKNYPTKISYQDSYQEKNWTFFYNCE